MAPPMSWACSDCGRAFSEKGNWKKHVTSQKCKGYTKTTEQDIELFEEPKEEDMFKYVFDKDDVRWAECNLCDSIVKVGTSKHANTGKMTAVRHFKTCHVPDLKKWKCTECKVAFVVRKSTTGYGHSGDCPERAGREEEKETKLWLREWDDETKTFTAVREQNAKLPFDLRPIKPSSEKKHKFLPVSRRKRATPSDSSSVSKRGRGNTRGRGRCRQPARKSSPKSSEEVRTSSDEESPPFPAGATSSEDSDASEIVPVERSRHSRSLVVKLKLSKEKLKSIVDKKVGHEVATASDSEYQVTKNRRQVPEQGPTRAKVVKASRNVSHPRQTSIDASSIPSFLERGYTPPRQSPRRSRSPTPSEDPHSDPGYFNEAFHVSSSDSDE